MLEQSGISSIQVTSGTTVLSTPICSAAYIEDCFVELAHAREHKKFTPRSGSESLFNDFKYKFITRLFENYCFVLLTNRAPPQISHNRPDMRQRALFVTSRAAWRWTKMLLARENVDSPLAAMVLATEHNALCASGCQPPSVDNGTGSRLNRVPAASSSMLAYLETLAVHAAFNKFSGFSTTSRILAWLSAREHKFTGIEGVIKRLKYL